MSGFRNTIYITYLLSNKGGNPEYLNLLELNTIANGVQKSVTQTLSRGLKNGLNSKRNFGEYFYSQIVAIFV